jgi:hypothetical protein
MRVLSALATCGLTLALPVGGLVASQSGGGIAPIGPRNPLCELPPASLAAIPASITDADPPYLRLIDHPERHELTIEVGPVDVAAHALAEHSQELADQLTHMPFDAWIHGYRVELIDATGARPPRELLHHIDTTRPAFRELFLPLPARFLGAGIDTQSERLPAWLIGAPIYRNEPLLVSTMLHNPTHTSYAGVRVRLVLSYTRSRPLVEVGSFYMDVRFPDAAKEFDLPPGHSEWTWEGSPAIPVTLIGLTGHLHRYAQWIEVRDVTVGKPIWRARPGRSRVDQSGAMPVHFIRFGFGYRLDPTHRYRITAVYDNPTGHAIPDGGMAKLGGIVIPAPSATWPRVDADDPLYTQDMQWKLQQPCSAVPEYVLHTH